MPTQHEIKSNINAALARLEQLKNSKLYSESEKKPLIKSSNQE